MGRSHCLLEHAVPGCNHPSIQSPESTLMVSGMTRVIAGLSPIHQLLIKVAVLTPALKNIVIQETTDKNGPMTK